MVPILLILLLLPAAAQTPARKKASVPVAAPAAQRDSWPLVGLTVKGNRIYTDQQVLRASGLKLGEMVSKAQFEAARERLIKTGAFDEVSFQFGPDASGKGYSGTMDVSEVEPLYPFQFEDLPATDAELRAFLKQREPLFEAKMPATREFLGRMAAEVKEFVAAKGFADGVAATVTPSGPGELYILFRPTTPLPNIGEVRFTGSQVLTSTALSNAFALVAVGTPYKEQRVRDLLETSVRPLYEGRGRLRVQFTTISAKKMENVDGMSVTVNVVEGPSFKVGEVKAAGSSLPAKDLLSAANIKTGDVANFTEIQAGADRIQSIFRKEGFMRSETRVERTVHDKDLTVDIEFRSNEGRRFEMGTLTIQGLDVTTEPAIRKLWSMTPGKPYNADYPQFFLDRVREDGYLDDLGRTRFDQKVNEAKATVDVTLYFTGAPPDPERRKKKRGPEF